MRLGFAFFIGFQTLSPVNRNGFAQAKCERSMEQEDVWSLREPPHGVLRAFAENFCFLPARLGERARVCPIHLSLKGKSTMIVWWSEV